MAIRSIIFVILKKQRTMHGCGVLMDACVKSNKFILESEYCKSNEAHTVRTNRACSVNIFVFRHCRKINKFLTFGKFHFFHPSNEVKCFTSIAVHNLFRNKNVFDRFVWFKMLESKSNRAIFCPFATEFLMILHFALWHAYCARVPLNCSCNSSADKMQHFRLCPLNFLQSAQMSIV